MKLLLLLKQLLIKPPPTVNFEDGRKALVLAETAFKSIASGKMETIDFFA